MSRTDLQNGPRLNWLRSPHKWLRTHPTQLVLFGISLFGLLLSIAAVQPLWTAPSFGFPHGDEFKVFTPDNYDPQAVISVCHFGNETRAAVTLTPSSDYVEMQLPAGATNVHLNNKLAPLLLDCSVQDIPSTYMALPDQSPPSDIGLIPELGSVHYSNRNPAPNVAGNSPGPIVPVRTRWWVLSPSQSRHRVSVYFQWPGAVQESNFTDRDMWVAVSTVHGTGVAEGQDPNTWTQVPMYVLWVLDSNSVVAQAPIDSSVTTLHGIPFAATKVSSSGLLRLSWRDTSLADSKDVRLFVGGIAIGIFGGLLTTVLFAVSVGIDWRLGRP